MVEPLLLVFELLLEAIVLGRGLPVPLRVLRDALPKEITGYGGVGVIF